MEVTQAPISNELSAHLTLDVNSKSKLFVEKSNNISDVEFPRGHACPTRHCS